MTKPFLILAALGGFAVSCAHASILANYTFGGATSADNPLPPLTHPVGMVKEGGLSSSVPLVDFGTEDFWVTHGFGNDGISVANTDYFEWTVAAETGFALSFSDISSRLGLRAVDSTFASAAGATFAFAYRTDAQSAFTLLPEFQTGPNNFAISNTTDLSGIADLQGVNSVTFRYYASSGGSDPTALWGGAENDFLTVDGTVTPVPEPSAAALLGGAGLLAIFLSRQAARRTFSEGRSAFPINSQSLHDRERKVFICVETRRGSRRFVGGDGENPTRR